jgi:uncharacterized protein (TIGR00369 family)
VPRNPFREVIGAEVVEVEKGRCVLRMPAREVVMNARDVVHGGALCTLADAALGTALRSALEPGDVVATIELKINFIAAGRGDMLARARTLHLGRTTAVGEVEIEDAGGALVAKAMATFHVKRGALPPRPGARTAMYDFDGPEPT